MMNSGDRVALWGIALLVLSLQQHVEGLLYMGLFITGVVMFSTGAISASITDRDDS